LVFVQEKGVFPLYCVVDFKELRRAYIFEARQSGAKPRHTNYRIDFPDLFPPDEREDIIRRRVDKALTLGRAFEFVREGRDVQTEEPAILYSYRDEHYALREINLGRTWEEAAQQMVQRQIDKEIYYVRPDEVTPLEHLEGKLRDEGERPRTVSEKEKGWLRLQRYLEQRARELPEGERDPAYQKERDFINEFRDEFQWKPPRDWKPAEVAPRATDEGSDAREFREWVRMLVRRSGGRLTPEQMGQLTQEGIEFYNLTSDVAQRIVSEEQYQRVEASEPYSRAAEQYRQAILSVIDPKTREISEEGRRLLEAKRRRLRLTPEQASAIEAEVISQMGVE
jgi:hypothetical protein